MHRMALDHDLVRGLQRGLKNLKSCLPAISMAGWTMDSSRWDQSQGGKVNGALTNSRTEVRVDDLETKRLETARKLFELADLNGDGLLSVDEFSEMGLNQTKVHAEKQLTPGDEQFIKDEFVHRYQRELDSSLSPVTCEEYQEYILRFANRIEPGDLKAQSMMLEGFLVEATIARCIAVEEASALPTILTSELGREWGKTADGAGASPQCGLRGCHTITI
eukprot:s1980_g2.t4